MDRALNPGMAASPSRANRGLFAWVAFALIGVLVASTFFLSGQTPPGNDGNELAWAPGLGTPDATAGADRMCEAEPLTTDDVMSILLNPLDEYERRGQTFDYDDGPFELYESQPPRRDNWANAAMTGTVDPGLNEELATFGNDFWNCLITGTTFQIWSYMDPGFLQWSILREFPVLRAEGQMRAFVEEWGPQQYTSFPHGALPNYVNVSIEQAAHTADRSEGSIRISTPRGLPGEETRIGIITMVLESGDDPLNYLEIYISEHPDGSWSVNGVGANPNTPRG